MAANVNDPRKNPVDHTELLRRMNLSREQRRPFERDWWLNLAYLSNEQYVEFVLETGNLIDRDVPEDEVQTVFNEMFKIVRTERAKILRTSPKPTALPAKDDDDDIMTARVLDAYYDKLMWEWNFDSRLRNATYWITATGNCFFNWYWDGDKNGENQMEILNPFEVYPDPYARRWDELRWCITSKFYDLETAWETWGDITGAHPEHLTPSGSAPFSSKEQRIYSDLGLTGGSGGYMEGVTVQTYYEPPTSYRKDGRYIIFTHSGVVLDTEYPYMHGKLPITHIGHIERSSSKWYASICDYLRQPQDELNRAESQMIVNRNLSQGKFIIPPEVKLDHMPNAEPRQIIQILEGPPGVSVGWETPDTIPAWVKEEPTRIRSIMNDLAHQHEVSQGGVPGRVESGQAIQLLQETDDSVMKDTIHSLQEALARGFWLCAANFVQFGDAERLIQTYDDNGGVEVRHLLKDKIDLSFRVRVNIATSLPANVAGKWDRVLNLVQYQIIAPEEARKLLELTVEEPSLDFTLKDRKAARRENLMLADADVHFDEETGAFQIPPDQVVTPQPEENHDVHIFEHEEFMKTEEFKDLHVWKQTLFRIHVGQHKDLRVQRIQEDVQLQMLMQGGAQPPPGGGGEGEPSGPPQQPDGQGPPPVAV